MFSLFRPHYRLDEVSQLTIERLRHWGLRSLLLDVDSTLKPYGVAEPTPDVTAWLETMKSENVGLCLVSNGSAHRIGPFAKSIGVSFVAPAIKPLPYGCRKAMRQMNFAPQTTALVGDQLFADVAAARLAGMIAILVKPISPELEPFWTRMKRPLERIINRSDCR